MTENTREFNREEALARVGDDTALLQEIAQLFIDSLPQMLGDIQAAIGNGDAGALERAAHTLKGCVANFGAPEAYRLALRLENLAREQSLASTPAVYSQLNAALDRLRLELNSMLP
jgi:two-component system, sensor histidine kinase and response regulator